MRIFWIAYAALLAVCAAGTIAMADQVPWWWLPAFWVPILLLSVFTYLIVSGPTVSTVTGQPVSGRDADRYAKWRARATQEQRMSVDLFLREQQRGPSQRGPA